MSPAPTLDPAMPVDPGPEAEVSPTGSATPTPPAPTPLPEPVAAPTGHPSTTVFGSLGHQVHLTFDDGPGPDTAAILDVLAAHGVRATFCVLGAQAQAHPELMRRIVDEGHTLCNHTWSHPGLFETLSAAELVAEVDRTQELLAQYAQVSWFRAPEGRFGSPGSLSRSAVADRGLWLLGWSIDSSDWRRPGPEVITTNVVDAIGPGAIVLLHDAGGINREQTVQSLPGIIAGLRAAGYDLVALPAAGPATTS